MSAALSVQPITARPLERPDFRFAPSFDAWLALNRRAVISYAFDVAMAAIDEDLEPVGLKAFARQQYEVERLARGLPQHVAAERPLTRYFTVEWSSAFSRGPRYEHVAVTDGGPEATQLVMGKIKSASSARVVRELDRAEFERLTH